MAMLDYNHLVPMAIATATTAIPSALYMWQHSGELSRQLKQRDEDLLALRSENAALKQRLAAAQQQQQQQQQRADVCHHQDASLAKTLTKPVPKAAPPAPPPPPPPVPATHPAPSSGSADSSTEARKALRGLRKPAQPRQRKPRASVAVGADSTSSPTTSTSPTTRPAGVPPAPPPPPPSAAPAAPPVPPPNAPMPPAPALPRAQTATTNAAPPKLKLKSLPWIKLKVPAAAASTGSVWCSNDSSGVPGLDSEALATLFADAPQAKTSAMMEKSSSSDTSNAKIKSVEVTLLDPKRANNMCILLSSLRKQDLSDVRIRDSLLSFDEAALDTDTLDMLQQQCPTAEELELLQSFTSTASEDELSRCAHLDRSVLIPCFYITRVHLSLVLLGQQAWSRGEICLRVESGSGTARTHQCNSLQSSI